MKKLLTITLFVFGLTVFAHKAEAINNYGYYDGGYQNTYAQPSTNSYMPMNYTYQNATATSTSYGGYGGYNNGGYYNQPVSNYYNNPLIWRMPSVNPGYVSYGGYTGYNTGYNGGYTGGYTNYATPNNNQYYNNYNPSYQQTPQYYNQSSGLGWRY